MITLPYILLYYKNDSTIIGIIQVSQALEPQQFQKRENKQLGLTES